MSFTSDDAAIGASALGAIAILWRLFFRGKKDIREDQKDVRDDQKSVKIEGGYGSLIDRLENTVKLQGIKIDDQDRFNHALGQRLNIETDRRRDCERQNHIHEIRIAQLERSEIAYRQRIDHLEAVVRGLGGEV